jgi:hypothetical protein
MLRHNAVAKVEGRVNLSMGGATHLTSTHRRWTRTIAPHRAYISRLRRDSVILTACDLASDAYHPARTEQDIFLTNVNADVEVAVGTRQCKGKVFLTVAFCGSERIGDWCHNLMIWTIAQKDVTGRVHAGFLTRWNAIASKLIGAIARLHAPRILITGHSLGGAVATLAAPDIARAFPRTPVTLITFGAPQTADARFHEGLPPVNLTCSIRCVHADDVVQWFPPFPWYSHPRHAHVLVVGRDTEKTKDRSSDVDRWGNALWHQLQRIWRRKLKLAHHQIFEYRRTLTLAEACVLAPLDLAVFQEERRRSAPLSNKETAICP